MVAPFIGQNIGENQKKKKVFAYQSMGFRSQKKKNKPKWYHLKMVTPVAGPSPNDATGYLTETFQAPAS